VNAPRPAFRAEDQSLLAELEDEMVVAKLFRAQAARPAELPSRASGLVAELRALPGGEAAVAAALERSDLAALFELLLSENLVRRPPRFVHHLAIYFDRVAASYAAEIATGHGDASALREGYLKARTRSLAAFFALYAERAYLAEHARKIAGSALSREEADATAEVVATSGLGDLGAAARAGARKLAADAGIALAALAATSEACRIAGIDAAARKQLERRADSIRASAVDEALSPILDALTEARVRDAPVDVYAKLFERVKAVWIWSLRDEAVERFAVDEVTAKAWIVYRTAKWQELGRLLEPCIELYESLAARIESDPKRHVAYSAKCAQVFVFRSDCAPDKEREWAHAERSIRLCSTHRNGRLSVAYLLCNRAIARLGSTWFPSSADVEAARADIARAEELFPQSTRLPIAKEKLKDVMDRMAGGRG
jgi:hypothetical protein